MGNKEGSWWCHSSTESYETTEKFTARAEKFRLWLAKECYDRNASHALVISHGGLLTHSFDSTKYENCEFRAFDLFHSGIFARTFKGNSNVNLSENVTDDYNQI